MFMIFATIINVDLVHSVNICPCLMCAIADKRIFSIFYQYVNQ